MEPFFHDHADSQMEVALRLINKRSVVLGNEFFLTLKCVCVWGGIIVIVLRQGCLSAGLIRMVLHQGFKKN